MITAPAPPQREPSQRDKDKPKREQFDPDSSRMTIGEHLEELRWRMILGLVGFFVAIILCLAFTERVVEIFCAPLVKAMSRAGLNPQMVYHSPQSPFMIYVQMSLISAAVIAGPW